MDSQGHALVNGTCICIGRYKKTKKQTKQILVKKGRALGRVEKSATGGCGGNVCRVDY